MTGMLKTAEPDETNNKMSQSDLHVRELEEKDIALLADYWFNATPEQLQAMGADISKLPEREAFENRLRSQLTLPYEKKEAYALIWEVNGKPAGHSNLNPVMYDGHGFMHLHLWDNKLRHKGIGTELVRMSLPYFFNNMKLRLLYCEPYALNPAPHKILEKNGFKFVKEYITTPGAITFEQPVKLWELKCS
jgi:RimJ/RimL family protein N-acetyltransferase